MKSLYMKGYKWLLPQNQGEKTFLVLDGTSYWLSIFFKRPFFKRHESERMSVPGLLALKKVRMVKTTPGSHHHTN